MPQALTLRISVFFERGKKSKNKQFIDFDEKLVLNTMEIEEMKYQLIGVIIEKLENENNEKEYISFIKKRNKQWVSNKDKEKEINFKAIKKIGIIFSLFYYCENKNMILNSQNNMTNINSYSQQFHNIQMNFNNNMNSMIFNNNGNNFNLEGIMDILKKEENSIIKNENSNNSSKNHNIDNDEKDNKNIYKENKDFIHELEIDNSNNCITKQNVEQLEKINELEPNFELLKK